MKCLLSGLKFSKYLFELQTGKTLIRLFLQKPSDLVLHDLWPAWENGNGAVWSGTIYLLSLANYLLITWLTQWCLLWIPHTFKRAASGVGISEENKSGRLQPWRAFILVCIFEWWWRWGEQIFYFRNSALREVNGDMNEKKYFWPPKKYWSVSQAIFCKNRCSRVGFYFYSGKKQITFFWNS